MALTEKEIDRLSKLKRLSESSNINEAKSAIAFLEKACKQLGVNPDDVVEDYNPEQDEPISFQVGDYFPKTDYAEAWLLQGVVKYFNGQVVCSYDRLRDKKYYQVFATKGARQQIIAYYDYLSDLMKKLAKEAKKETPDSGRSFSTNFKKAFAITISERLDDLKNKKEKEGLPESNISALVVQNRNVEIQSRVNKFYRQECPHVRTARASVSGGNGSGGSAGRAAGISAGLNKQVNSGAGQRRLAGV